MKKCIECANWIITGQDRHCPISLGCINSSSRPRFLHKDDVKPIPEPKLQWGKDKTKRRQVMSEEELVNAARSRQIQAPIYPDMKTLTEESKRELRRGKRRK